MLRPITWIHTADLHLDQPVSGWHGSKSKALQRREDYRETFERIISVVKQKDVDFLFIAGDFLEHGYVQASTVQFVREGFEQIPDTRVLIAPGNHDPYRADSFYYPREEWPSHVHIFRRNWEILPFEELGVTVYGKGFGDYLETEWSPPPRPSSNGKHIMIAHGTFYSSSNRVGKCPYFPIPENELLAYPFDYIALGHIHKPALIRLNNKKFTGVCYPGSPEALSWKETGERFVVQGTLLNNSLDIQWIPVHTRIYKQIHCDISDCYTREDLFRMIQDKCQLLDKTNCFRIYLEGRYPAELNIEAELFWLYEKMKTLELFQFSIVNEAIPDFDLSFYRKQKNVVGLFVQKMEEKMKENPDEVEHIERAMYEGLKALCAKR